MSALEPPSPAQRFTPPRAAAPPAPTPAPTVPSPPPAVPPPPRLRAAEAGDPDAPVARPPGSARGSAATLATTELLSRPSVTLCPWPDPVVDRFGHDPRSVYAERYWLPVLGPSALWLLRHLVAGFDDRPEQYELDLLDAPRAIGVGGRGGNHSPFANTVNRLIQFGFLQITGPSLLIVRTKMPTLTRRQLLRVPERLRAAHDDEVEQHQRTHAPQDHKARARTLALSLLELGEDVHIAEKQLHRWRFHPAIAFDAVRWAAEQHGLADTSTGATASHHPIADATPVDPPHANDGAA
jgi:hypothetical protein